MGLAALGAGFFSLGACSKSSASEDDDRARLSAVLAADAKVDGFLGEADRLDRQGRSADAAKVVETEATPALGEAKALLDHTVADTAWGRDRRDELAKLLGDRAAAMPSYVTALRGTDPTAKLEAVMAQAALEKRALGVATAMKKKATP